MPYYCKCEPIPYYHGLFTPCFLIILVSHMVYSILLPQHLYDTTLITTITVLIYTIIYYLLTYTSLKLYLYPLSHYHIYYLHICKLIHTTYLSPHIDYVPYLSIFIYSYLFTTKHLLLYLKYNILQVNFNTLAYFTREIS